MREGLFHNLLQCQWTVNEEESTINTILDTMTSKMYPVAFLHMMQHCSNGGLLVIQSGDTKSAGRALKCMNSLNLFCRPRKAILARCCGLRDSQEMGSMPWFQGMVFG